MLRVRPGMLAFVLSDVLAVVERDKPRNHGGALVALPSGTRPVSAKAGIIHEAGAGGPLQTLVLLHHCARSFKCILQCILEFGHHVSLRIETSEDMKIGNTDRARRQRARLGVAETLRTNMAEKQTFIVKDRMKVGPALD